MNSTYQIDDDMIFLKIWEPFGILHDLGLDVNSGTL